MQCDVAAVRRRECLLPLVCRVWACGVATSRGCGAGGEQRHSHSPS